MSDLSESKSRTADGRFIKGCPAGPGRPRKAVRAAADALDERVAAKADDLFEMAFRQADEGNATALKALLDRVWPVGRSRPLEIGAPPIKHPRDLLTAMAGVTDAMFNGNATAAESAAAAKVIKAHFKAIEDIEFEKRLTEVEEVQRRREGK
jgi:hypothetical protein